MANERNTENIARKLLREQGYLDNENIVIEEQTSTNPKIDKLLAHASKSKNGPGHPEFIITFVNTPSMVMLIECKADPKYHQSSTKKRYADYAVDGALLYASYLKDSFDVVAVAVSGEIEREIKISNFLWLKDKETYKDVADKRILDPNSLSQMVEKQSQPIKEEELVRKAIEYNELLHGYSIPEIDRCTVISSILVALQNKAFQNSYASYHTDEDGPDYNPNIDLIEALLKSCEVVLKRNRIVKDKKDIIIREYGKIQSNHTFRSRTIQQGRREVKNTVLRDLIDDVMDNIMPYIKNNVYDVLGKFYTQFIRYAGSDSKTGLVLTPPHVADFFCDLADINENDIVFDPCCGTGGFLVAAMNRMIALSGNNIEKHKRIRSNQLIGVEKRADMFSHACSNMMMRGDGKSHILFGDCFSNKCKRSIALKKPTKAFLNPPYDVGVVGQLEFMENALEVTSANGLCVAICQMSTCIDTKGKPREIRQRLLDSHTLEAVLSMPDDLFYPVGVITSIVVFRAHTPHPKGKKTFFGYFKNDGFLKIKNQGRIDQKNQWSRIKTQWLDIYKNRETVAGLSVMKEVAATDEWCAEAYMETDYGKLTQKDFELVVKNYALFRLIGQEAVGADDQ